MLGRTTQNFASCTISPAACLAILAVTCILAKSEVNSTWVTFPMMTSLYLTKVFPASMPSAAPKMIVTSGPSLRMRCTAIPMATTAARIGMIHITEIRPRFRGTTVASGNSSVARGSAMMDLELVGGVPDQTRVEGLRRQHRQHDHRHEEHHSRPGLHRHQRLELHERDDEGVDEDVEHRPAPDELHHLVDAGAVVAVPGRAALHGDQQVSERGDLPQRNHHA